MILPRTSYKQRLHNLSAHSKANNFIRVCSTKLTLFNERTRGRCNFLKPYIAGPGKKQHQMISAIETQFMCS